MSASRRSVGAEQRQQCPGAERRGDRHAHPEVGAQAAVAARQPCARRPEESSPCRSRGQRDAQQRRGHEARDHPVGERLGGVGLAEGEHPDSERPAHGAEHDDLGDRVHKRALPGGANDRLDGWDERRRGDPVERHG
jgi:hypothetical protein